ncbi:hypothetical protein K443DRAFT_217847 [Laccaria amethystina LaAM-08-1]|uniref:Uncharacterized protein n=1 Tax=Laccaria amethystina LaAM-08-1 TaxID=1095629 RepID=A0A0C9XPX5_9AGAR|nr:hypothetical protein K443DRAFT_217847 [Laccaria amethystina LaAM-08-1]
MVTSETRTRREGEEVIVTIYPGTDDDWTRGVQVAPADHILDPTLVEMKIASSIMRSADIPSSIM